MIERELRKTERVNDWERVKRDCERIWWSREDWAKIKWN